ncbi:mitochondrial uncoupling protein 4C-like [Drosophila nasuta]|uniref:mitochondrial uncoupling protein 4C-like n=1 Tax=Drosophila nasuta TaxID=42062 RepID=UPI00295ED8A3|nr:mitochondrial uncoupling protein 4C-like [Drosophila nasuta]
MDKDRNNYWHMRTPYDTSVVIRSYHEELSLGNLFQFYANTLVGANIAGALVHSMDVNPLRLLAKVTDMSLHQMSPEPSAKSLYAGISTVLLRGFLFNSLRVTLYDVFRRQFFYMDAINEEMISIPGALVSGSIAGCIAQALYHPLEHLHREAFSWTRAIKTIQSKSLWHAMPLSCTQACLLTLGDVAAYDLSKQVLRKQLQLPENLTLHLPAALFAGLAASLLSHPVEVMRLHLLQQPLNERGKRSVEYLLKFMQEEGSSKLFKGLLPACLRSSSWSVIFWLCVEQLREWEGQRGF